MTTPPTPAGASDGAVNAKHPVAPVNPAPVKDVASDLINGVTHIAEFILGFRL